MKVSFETNRSPHTPPQAPRYLHRYRLFSFCIFRFPPFQAFREFPTQAPSPEAAAKMVEDLVRVSVALSLLAQVSEGTKALGWEYAGGREVTQSATRTLRSGESWDSCPSHQEWSSWKVCWGLTPGRRLEDGRNETVYLISHLAWDSGIP